MIPSGFLPALRRMLLVRELLAAWLCGLLLIPAQAISPVAPPAWWAQRSVIDPARAGDDFAAVNQGQLKHLVSAAIAEMNARLTGGAGPVLNDLVSGWQAGRAQADDFAVANIGQVKAVARPVYQRLLTAGVITSLPAWATASSPANEDFAVANIGQVKHLFAFTVPDQTATGEGVTLPADSPFIISYSGWQSGAVRSSPTESTLPPATMITLYTGVTKTYRWQLFSNSAPPEKLLVSSHSQDISSGTTPEAWKTANHEQAPYYLRHKVRIEAFYKDSNDTAQGYNHLNVYRSTEQLNGGSWYSGPSETFVETRYWTSTPPSTMEAIVNTHGQETYQLVTSQTWQEASYTETQVATGAIPPHWFKQEAEGPVIPPAGAWSAAPESSVQDPLAALASPGGSIPFSSMVLPTAGGVVASAQASLTRSTESYLNPQGQVVPADRYNGRRSRGTVLIGWRSEVAAGLSAAEKQTWLARFQVVKRIFIGGNAHASVETTSLSSYLTASGTAPVSLPELSPFLLEGISQRIEMSLNVAPPTGNPGGGGGGNGGGGNGSGGGSGGGNGNGGSAVPGKLMLYSRLKEVKASAAAGVSSHGVFKLEGAASPSTAVYAKKKTVHKRFVNVAQVTALPPNTTVPIRSGGEVIGSRNTTYDGEIRQDYLDNESSVQTQEWLRPILIEPNHGSPEELPELQADEVHEHERTFISLHDVTKTVTVNESEDSPHRTYSSTETGSDFVREIQEAELKPADPGDELSVPSYVTDYHKSGYRTTVNHWQRSWTDGTGVGHSESGGGSSSYSDPDESQERPWLFGEPFLILTDLQSTFRIDTATKDGYEDVLMHGDELAGRVETYRELEDPLPWTSVDAAMKVRLAQPETEAAWVKRDAQGTVGVAVYECRYHPGEFSSKGQMLSWYVKHEMPAGTAATEETPPLTQLVYRVYRNPANQIVHEDVESLTVAAGKESRVFEDKVTANEQLPEGGSVTVSFLPVELAVDVNRDGTITQGETASQDRPFRFWIDNDDDPNTLGDDVEVAMKKDELSPPDFEDWRSAPALGHIDGVRDLEDFARLRLSLPADIIQKAKSGKVKVGFKWTQGSAARIRIYKAQSNIGDEKYLFYKHESNLQVDSDHQLALLDVDGNQTVFLPGSYWQSVPAGTSNLNFIFEGCEKGTAKLAVFLKFESSAEIEGSGIWIKLMDVQEMFERGKVAPPMSEPDNVPDPWVTTEPLTFQSISDPNGNGFQPDPDETKQYIIHVHGWRMSYNEAQTWANTSFKRLWHLGYKGRFAFFSWPTFSNATSVLDGYLTYNKSEYRAWLSGAALKSYVESLPGGYTKNIMAHSMGNVVVGSAFRQGMEGISNYALFNAAMAAQAYDPTQIDFPARQTPDTDSDLTVQTRFGLSGKFSGITAKVTNFYLEDDLATTIWSTNHAINKPQGILAPLDSAYSYSNSGWNVGGNLHKLVQCDPIILNVPLRGVTTSEEAMAFVTQTRSLPAGRTPANLGFADSWQINMDTYVFENNYRSLFGSEHSAEWIWSFQRTFGVWRALLNSFDINPNPIP